VAEVGNIQLRLGEGKRERLAAVVPALGSGFAGPSTGSGRAHTPYRVRSMGTVAMMSGICIKFGELFHAAFYAAFDRRR
jgi:hypothetical protein